MKQSNFLTVTTSWDDGHENDEKLAKLLNVNPQGISINHSYIGA